MIEYVLAQHKNTARYVIILLKKLEYGFDTYITYSRRDIDRLSLDDLVSSGRIEDISDCEKGYVMLFRTKKVKEISEEHLKIVMPEIFL